MSADVLARVQATCTATCDVLDVAAAEVAGSDPALTMQILMTAAALRRHSREIRPTILDPVNVLDTTPDDRWGHA